MRTYIKYVAVFLLAVMLISSMIPAASAKSWDNISQLKKIGNKGKRSGFSDVDDKVEWARLAIDRMHSKGIFTGYPGNIFKPKNNVTHLEANNNFNPNAPITRAELAVILNRLEISIERENKDKLVGTIEDVDADGLTVTIKNSYGIKTYEVLEDVPVYVDGKYGSLEDLLEKDKVELVLDEDGDVVFIQILQKVERKTTAAEGLVVDVNQHDKSITLLTLEKYKGGILGTLKISNIEGRHYELEAQQGRFVLIGDTDGLEDYVDEKIVVKGKISYGPSIYMRGPLINVEDFSPVTSKHTKTYYTDKNTIINVDGKVVRFSKIKAGDYAKIKAEDDLALQIKVMTATDKNLKE